MAKRNYIWWSNYKKTPGGRGQISLLLLTLQPGWWHFLGTRDGRKFLGIRDGRILFRNKIGKKLFRNKEEETLKTLSSKDGLVSHPTKSPAACLLQELSSPSVPEPSMPCCRQSQIPLDSQAPGNFWGMFIKWYFLLLP